MKHQDITALFSGQLNNTEYNLFPGSFLFSTGHVINKKRYDKSEKMSLVPKKNTWKLGSSRNVSVSRSFRPNLEAIFRLRKQRLSVHSENNWQSD